MDLTKRQQEIFDFIKKYSAKYGYPPTVRDIGKAVGLASSSTVHAHLANLEKIGLLRRDPSKPRALELLDRAVGTAAPTGPAVRSHPRGILASLSAHRTLSVKQARHGIRVHAVLAAPGTADLRLERLGGRRAKTLAHTQASRALAGTLILHLKPRRLAAGRYRVVATPVIDGVLDRGASVSLALRITRRL